MKFTGMVFLLVFVVAGSLVSFSNSVRDENIAATSMKSRGTGDYNISSFSGYFLLNV
jgi:hypothetical protein